MSQSNIPDSPEMSANDSSFGDILTQFEQSHHSRGETVEGTVMTVTADAVFVDIGRKMDGTLPRDPAVDLKPGTKLLVSIRGRDEDGTYQLSTIKVETPRDWSALEAAFAEKKIIGGTVIEAVECARSRIWRSSSASRSSAASRSSTRRMRMWWSIAAPFSRNASAPPSSKPSRPCRKAW